MGLRATARCIAADEMQIPPAKLHIKVQIAVYVLHKPSVTWHRLELTGKGQQMHMASHSLGIQSKLCLG